MKPKRMCVVCREMKEKDELIRVVKTPDGEVKIDETGKLNGRGAYLCKSNVCIENAKKRKAIDRALGVAVPEQLFENLRGMIIE